MTESSLGISSDATTPRASAVLEALKRMAIPILAVAVIGAAIISVVADWNVWIAGASSQSTDDATVSADISTLSAQVSGTIKSFPVNDYERVTKGQLIAEIDPKGYLAAVAIATANLDAAKATLANLSNQIDLQRAVIAAAAAQNSSAVAEQNQADEEYQRQINLGEATSKQMLQQAQAVDLQSQAAVISTAAAMEQQAAQLKVLQGQKPLLESQVDAAAGNLEMAEINQSYTSVYAPFDGLLGKRLVHVGDYVSTGTGLVSEIPLPNVYVMANFKETQLSRMRIGDSAEISVDTFPGQTLRGRVAEVAPASGSVSALLPPDNATGNYTKVVQRIPVKISFDPDQSLIRSLRPGMSATVKVDTPGTSQR
ncbi:HlyD family secretion protein [Aliirhizobium cellulosilyticum]|uniref:Membrane fusion protein (Multidrug efflux system) n=1 Tax=Aliirhizobium cellulosilyticum TaxID=393664 RepID=A0A7W6UZA0_9HYPH|nr:HlyD family secretion protein [Rhizobium cellulosilyticum]MBB4349353.1 membrane fusion protein (multidrug efflux system) [Rhizobium cellulosilyticum]MBB4412425.1 membrane fusion protein (multidrug efflux system) [Rhizobium cellulosilyticum]MBB4447057.1 membrane fusion protein (multidrug efflux system) [Rhizobium cellulosilyticum]